jgi:hypothetical protein
MIEKKPIEKLREAVLNSNNKLLEEQVVNSSDINFILDKFTIYTENKDYYDDVSIYNIVALCRSDKWIENVRTWRELVNEWITGEGWTNQVFDYFESDIKSQDFPADNAMNTLRFIDYDGLLTCSNGNHRLVGACCWISANNKTELKQVLIRDRYDLDPNIKSFFKELKNDQEVFVSREEKTIRIVCAKYEIEYFYEKGKEPEKISTKRKYIIIEWILKKFNLFQNNNFVRVPSKYINIWKIR